MRPSEDLALKQQLFRTLDGACPQRTILASTTSALLPSVLAGATLRPDRVLVAHSFNPPALVPLVELVRGPERRYCPFGGEQGNEHRGESMRFR